MQFKFSKDMKIDLVYPEGCGGGGPDSVSSIANQVHSCAQVRRAKRKLKRARGQEVGS